VVPVYDLGVDDKGRPWFSMKRIRGVSFEEIFSALRRGQPEFVARFNRRRLLSAFSSVCLAVDYAHSRGVLHRDLKPSNIMIGDFGEVHLLDWGLARVHGASELPVAKRSEAQALSHTLNGELMGSPGYMSPEQARGEHELLTASSDVYSLGAILFELLTLTPLVSGEMNERIQQTLKGTERTPSVRSPFSDVPVELDAIVLHATELTAGKRFNTARELAEAVEVYLDGDRDLKVRAAMATALVDGATPLLTSVEIESRVKAVGDLVRAVALNPADPRPAKMLAKALSEVPETLPAELAAKVTKHEAFLRATGGRLASRRYAAWLLWALPVIAMGVTSWPMVLAMTASVAMTAVLAAWLARRPELGVWGGAIVFAASSVSLLLMTAQMGPLLLIPAAVATNTVYFSAFFKRRWLILGGLAPILLSWLAEKLALVPPSLVFNADSVTVMPRVTHLPPLLTELVLLVTAMAGVIIPALMINRIRGALELKERQLFLHSWLLNRASASK
jgi:serine/threonine-protein kinase